MAKVTVSFTIEEDQLTRVDALAVELDRDRSSTLRQVIEAGIPAVQMHAQIMRQALTDRPTPTLRYAPEVK